MTRTFILDRDRYHQQKANTQTKEKKELVIVLFTNPADLVSLEWPEQDVERKKGGDSVKQQLHGNRRPMKCAT